MINIYNYYSLKLNIINYNQNEITQEQLKELLKNIQNIPTSILKWDLLFYVQEILLPNICNIHDSIRKDEFISFFLNSLYFITENDYEISEKQLLYQYCILASKNSNNMNLEQIKYNINTIQDILNNENYSNCNEKYIYFFLQEKLRQMLVKEYNKLSPKEFYENREEINRQLTIVNNISFITE